ncbi:hypothetical protein ACFL9U_09710 [Thermodesulfobacteriota bacterium]
MRKKVTAILLALFFLVGILGCSSYYQIKDPASGSMYYTQKIKNQKEGAIKFKDAKSKSEVTLQNSEVKTISSKEYKTGLKDEE